MVRHAFGESITVTRRGEPTGTYDDTTGAEIVGPDTSFPVSDVAVEPAGTTEDPQSMGLWVATGFTLYLPFGTELRPTDRVTVRGVEGWQVAGDTTASGWRNPFTGAGKGSVVSVKRAV